MGEQLYQRLLFYDALVLEKTGQDLVDEKQTLYATLSTDVYWKRSVINRNGIASIRVRNNSVATRF